MWRSETGDSPVGLFRRDEADMAADHPPWSTRLSRPHARVAKGAVMERSTHVHRQSRAERRDRDVRTHAPDAQLFRLVGAKSNGAGPVSIEVLRLRGELSVGSDEEQVG